MAELNVFRTIKKSLTGGVDTVYTAPTNYTGIILSTQITNASDSDVNLTFTIHDSAAAATGIELLSQFTIPGRDTANGSVGKLVVTTGGVLKMEASGAADTLKVVVGVLESLDG
jgi:hypothetical protein